MEAPCYALPPMDVLFVRSSVYSLPSAKRVGAIVYDGASDMQLWPGPGSDRDLREAWGRDLQRALDLELKSSGRKTLEDSEVIRVTRGLLHCDFLAWVATRPPERGTSREAAPSLEALSAAVGAALRFVAERSVERVAFGALAGGPGEADRAERLATIVKAANAYEDECFKTGQNPVVEEVLVCEPLASVLRDAQNKVRGLAKAAEPLPLPKKKAPASRKTAARKPRKVKAPVLTAEDVAAARAGAERYSMRMAYSVGDWIQHPKFGLGRIEETTAENAIVVLFEDGQSKKLVHKR